MTQKITPFLWFDDNPEEATSFYVSIIKNAEVLSVNRSGDAGPVTTTSFRLAGQEFIALNGGSAHRFTRAVSFFVGCETEDEIDALWAALARGGTVLMALDRYPFSDKYGWVPDRFGVSWQLSISGQPQTVTPFLMFVGEQHGRAEEAIDHYTSVFTDASVAEVHRYGHDAGEPEGTVMHARFVLGGKQFMAMESSGKHPFTFTEATSFLVDCASQEEVDYFSDRLSAGGEPGQCGWLKDRFGLSWQVVPSVLGEMLRDEDRARANRVTQAMLRMTKIDVATLRQAYEQD